MTVIDITVVIDMNTRGRYDRCILGNRPVLVLTLERERSSCL